VNKIMLALATVATIGLTTAAFAETTPSMKDVQPAHAQASVMHKKTASHRVGARHVAYKHPVYRPGAHVARYSHYAGKKHCAKHVTAKRTVRTKTSAA
jgi:hypothetical protein